MPGKGKYKSKKRASHYEEKVAIDASFEDVIKIALNMKPNTLFTSKRFVFKGKSTSVIKMTEKERMIFLRENYAIKIPETLASNITVTIKVISASIPPIVLSIAEKVSKNKDGHIITESRTIPYAFSGNVIEDNVEFPVDKNDIVCDTLLFDCDPIDKDAVIEFSAITKTKSSS